MSDYLKRCEKAALDVLLGELDPATDPDRVAADVVLKVLDAGRLSECPVAVKGMLQKIGQKPPGTGREWAETVLRAAEDVAQHAGPPKWREKTTTLENAVWEGQGVLRLSDGCDVDAGDLAEEGFLPEHSTDREGTWAITLRFEETGGV